MFLPTSRDELGMAVWREERKRGEDNRVAEGGLVINGERLEKDWS